MSLPDSAEYWWDVKRNRSSGPNTFFHAKGLDCGHNHNVETAYIDDVTCYACKKIIAENPPDNMKPGPAPEAYYLRGKDRTRYFARKAFIEQHGHCSCGYDWAIRTNSKDRTQFLGCSNYPKCRKTKPYKENGKSI